MLKNLQNQLLSLLVVSTIVPVSTVGLYGIFSSTKAISDLSLSQVDAEVANRALDIEKSLAGINNDLTLLSHVPPIQGIIQAKEHGGIDPGDGHHYSYITYENWRKRAITIFQVVMSTKPGYRNLRYLDETGQELVKLDASQGINHVATTQELENVSDQEFFKQTSKLKKSQIYISPITVVPKIINQTNQSDLVIYYATPIFNAKTGKRRGSVVITVYVNSFVRSLKKNLTTEKDKFFLITQNGDYIFHSDSRKNWQPEIQEWKNLKKDYPDEISRKILSETRGNIQNSMGTIISHYSISLDKNNKIIVVYELPKYTVLKSVSIFKKISLAIVVLSLGTVLLIGISIVRKISKSQTTLYEQAQSAAATAEAKATQLERTLIELHRTQTQLVQTEKMSSLGQLVAGVAHEINNPVNFIYGNLNHVNAYTDDLLKLIRLYQSHYPNPDLAIQEEAETIDIDFLMADMPKMLDSMKMGADRIRQIVLSLRNFSRVDESDVKAVDIHDGIESTLLILQNRIKAHANFPGVSIIKEYGDLPLVECYAGQLNQVFMNLLGNAIDALEERKEKSCDFLPAIRIQTTLQKDSQQNNSQQKVPQVCIRITDNGLGIPAELISRLFESFFTTKPIGKGTGLGLSISYQIITEKHHGTLECFSEPGQGTEFRIQIPMHQSQVKKELPLKILT